MVTNFHFCDVIPEDSTIAVGDIHGCYDQFAQFLDWVGGSGARVILLGDLIDRGPHDVAVLMRVKQLLNDPESWGLHSVTALRGNHEQMLLNALDHPSGWADWIRNGGAIEDIELIEKHADWIRGLPYYVTVGDTLFSHAGCHPGEDPAYSMRTNSLREQFVWMREPFLSWGPQFEKWNANLKQIVFGHTPRSPLPYRIPDGICIDTGAFQTGVLTSYNSTYNTFNQFEIE
jgi:serine/threonine protein phosphatase 1